MTEPYGAPPPPPPPPSYPGTVAPKPRPSAWWWALGPGLIVAAIVAFVVLLVVALGSVTHTIRDATVVVADGRPHDVRLAHAGTGYLWRGSGEADPACTIADSSTGRPMALRPNLGSTSITDNGLRFVAVASFDVGSGRLAVTCTSPSQDPYPSVLIGPDPHLARSVVLILLAVFVPGLVGLIGIIVLIVTAVIWSRRAPRAGNLSAPRPIS